MYQVIIVIHVLLGLGIIGLVLMQQGKGADAGAAFGAGASGSVFGAQGAASFLSRSTAILATLFFMTSLGLAVLNSQQGVAYDLMSDTTIKSDTLAIPEVDDAKKEEVAKPATPISEKPVDFTPKVEADKSAEVSSAPDSKKEPEKK